MRVPRSINEAYKLDLLNNNTKWADAIIKELCTLHEEYNCFKALPKEKGEGLPAEYAGYKYIPLLWAFAVKFDGRHHARCVAGGNKKHSKGCRILGTSLSQLQDIDLPRRHAPW